ncbi:MAG: hypothetical protein M1469_04415 [Bacteroidetes bacterium]|nr:hypothetical protein [Bacteroidota bacterium]
MNLAELEKRREEILSEIGGIGDMRSGSISVRYQRCSYKGCECHKKGHPGHGPIYSFSTMRDGKTKINNYKLGLELAKVEKEVENYQRFRELTQKPIAVNNEICEKRSVPVVKDEMELEEIKKNSRSYSGSGSMWRLPFVE